MSKGGETSVSQTVDPATQEYVNRLRQVALGYAGISGGGSAPAAPRPGYMPNAWGGLPGFNFRNRLNQMQPDGAASADGSPLNLPQATIDPALLEALKGYGGYADAGRMGLTALAGGSNPFLNPYMDALGTSFDEIRRRSLSSVGDAAQLAGAFGGSRQGVAEGTALGEIGREEGLARMGAFDQAQNRAAQAAGFGLAGLGGQAELARYIQEYPQLFAGRQLGILNAGIGPYGTTQTQHTSSDPFSQFLGIGTLFLPGGPLAGLFGGGGAKNLAGLVKA